MSTEIRIKLATMAGLLAILAHFGGSVWLIATIASTQSSQGETVRELKLEQTKRSGAMFQIQALNLRITALEADISQLQSFHYQRQKSPKPYREHAR